MSAPPPQTLSAHTADGELEIRWEGSPSYRVPFRELRGLCPCANCVNEHTGERMFFPRDAENDVHPQKMNLVGNYAVKIAWSDGHQNGLFTWEYLRQICDSLIEDPASRPTE